MKTIMNIEGMKCEGCENRIKNVIKDSNIENITANYKKGIIIIETSSILDIEQIKKKINNLGFEVKSVKNE